MEAVTDRNAGFGSYSHGLANATGFRGGGFPDRKHGFDRTTVRYGRTGAEYRKQ